MTSHIKTFLGKVSKLLTELNEVFNFEKFLIYVPPKFNWNLICVGYLYFWKGILTQNVYSGKFSGFYSGLFVWGGGGGESILKHWFWSQAATRKNFFRPTRGSGGMLPGKFWKDSVQDRVKSHFWTLVTFTDSLIGSSNKISIWNSFKLFFRKNFFIGWGGA